MERKKSKLENGEEKKGVRTGYKAIMEGVQVFLISLSRVIFCFYFLASLHLW
jgi:hypothetical protein